MNAITPEIVAAIRKHRRAGRTFVNIAKRVGCSKDTARRVVRRAEQSERLTRPLSRPASRIDFAPERPPVVPPADSDPRSLYLAEKARRAERPNPLMDAARVEFEAMLAAQKLASKKGRPKRMVFRVSRSKWKDLADELPAYFGSDLSEVRSA